MNAGPPMTWEDALKQGVWFLVALIVAKTLFPIVKEQLEWARKQIEIAREENRQQIELERSEHREQMTAFLAALERRDLEFAKVVHALDRVTDGMDRITEKIDHLGGHH